MSEKISGGTEPTLVSTLSSETTWAQPLIDFRWLQKNGSQERSTVLQQQWAVHDGNSSRIEWRDVPTVEDNT